VTFGAALHVPRVCDDERFEEWRLDLERLLVSGTGEDAPRVAGRS